MIDTNQLLSVAFSLISSFTNVVNIPSATVPQQRDDLARIVVGGPYSPLDLWLVCKGGDEFWIRRGVVNQYLSPDSYFRAQNVGALSRLKGTPKLSPDEVLELATNIVRRLAKNGGPSNALKPQVKRSVHADIPFYLITLPATEEPGHLPVAEVEIDARSGRVVALDLWGEQFFDLPYASEISNRVYRLDAQRTNRAPVVSRPVAEGRKPTAAEVESFVPKWLKFCERLGLDPGSQTNLADVDWGTTFKAKSPTWLPEGTLYKIQFRNGTVFQCVNGTMFSHVCPDASFVGAWGDKPQEYWNAFIGKPLKKWEALAKELNDLLVHRLGVSQTHLDGYTPTLYTTGTGGVTRCVVRWCERKSVGKIRPDSIKTALWVEFDLETGEMKNLTFDDWSLLQWQEQR